MVNKFKNKHTRKRIQESSSIKEKSLIEYL